MMGDGLNHSEFMKRSQFDKEVFGNDGFKVQ